MNVTGMTRPYVTACEAYEDRCGDATVDTGAYINVSGDVNEECDDG